MLTFGRSYSVMYVAHEPVRASSPWFFPAGPVKDDKILEGGAVWRRIARTGNSRRGLAGRPVACKNRHFGWLEHLWRQLDRAHVRKPPHKHRPNERQQSPVRKASGRTPNAAHPLEVRTLSDPRHKCGIQADAAGSRNPTRGQRLRKRGRCPRRESFEFRANRGRGGVYRDD